MPALAYRVHMHLDKSYFHPENKIQYAEYPNDRYAAPDAKSKTNNFETGRVLLTMIPRIPGVVSLKCTTPRIGTQRYVLKT